MWDRFIGEFDKGLRTIFSPAATARPLPAGVEDGATLTRQEKNLAAALMRVNHSGEVCAQALYQGQALTAGNPAIRAALERAALEETEHLNWCETRLKELGTHKSYLNPVWYTGSLAMGMLAGSFGDKWSLGFLAETERQVEKHLQGHLEKLPATDFRSRAVVAQMKLDEASHAITAVEHGAAELPLPVQVAMRFIAAVMTTLAFRL